MIPIELRDDPDEPGAAEAYVVATVAGREYRLILDTGGARSTLPLDDLTSTFARVDVDDESPSWAQRRGGLHEPA